MALQKTYTRAYAEQLQREVENNISLYAQSEFGTDESQELIIPNVEHPEGLLDKMLAAKSDAEAAITLYKAYSTLTPLQASQNAFWVYLAHTELFPYVQKRWPKVLSNGCNKKYILDHWFIYKFGLTRHALSGLWWAVYCTIDKDHEYPFIYTSFFLSNYTLRVVRLGPTKLFRHKEAVIGIIKYLLKTKFDSSTNSMEDRVNFVVSYFNKLGATKQLVYLNRDFFFNELAKVKYELMNYHHKKTAEEVEVENEDQV